MAVTIKESGTTRLLKIGVNSEARKEFFIDGTNDETVALAKLYAEAPAIITWIVTGWATFKGYAIDFSVEQISDVKWKGVVTYGDATSNTAAQPVGFSVLDFSFGGGTTKIDQGFAQTNYVPSGGKATNFHHTINNQDGNVNGVEIQTAEAKFSIVWVFDPTSITATFKKDLLNVLINPVNDASFYGYDAGEVIFRGATGRRRSESKYEIKFDFAYSPNQTDLTIGESPNQITGISKKGWEYLWITYAAKPDDTSGLMVQTAMQANVAQIYQTSDFSKLGIGTTDNT